MREATDRINEALAADTTEAQAAMKRLADDAVVIDEPIPHLGLDPMNPAAPLVILCAAPECTNTAGPEGFCPDHEDLAAEARERIKTVLAVRAQTAALDALRKAARHVVNDERRDRWRKTTKAKKSRSRMADQSRRKQR